MVKDVKTQAALAAAVALVFASARVLVDHAPLGLRCEDLVEGPEGLIKSLEQGGVVDAHPDAVVYAMSQGAHLVRLDADAVPGLVGVQVAATGEPAGGDAGGELGKGEGSGGDASGEPAA
jgi:hypothetical protein